MKIGILGLGLIGGSLAKAYKVAGQYRLRLLVKCRLSPALRRLYGKFLLKFSEAHPDALLTVDFNPTDL